VEIPSPNFKQNDCVKGEKYETADKSIFLFDKYERFVERLCLARSAAIFFNFLSIRQETKSVDGQWRKQKNGTFQPFFTSFRIFCRWFCLASLVFFAIFAVLIVFDIYYYYYYYYYYYLYYFPFFCC